MQKTAMHVHMYMHFVSASYYCMQTVPCFVAVKYTVYCTCLFTSWSPAGQVKYKWQVQTATQRTYLSNKRLILLSNWSK